MQFEYRDKISFWRWSEARGSWVTCPGSHSKLWWSQNSEVWSDKGQALPIPCCLHVLFGWGMKISRFWMRREDRSFMQARREGYAYCIGRETEPQKGLLLWSSLGAILILGGHLVITEDILDCSCWWGEDAAGISWVKAGDAATHLPVHRTAPQQKITQGHRHWTTAIFIWGLCT